MANTFNAETFQSITLSDGRRLAYLDIGCTQAWQASLLVLHGMMSCRLNAIPGISEATLKELGIRLISVDRPGYGRSDPHKSGSLRSFCKDMEALIDGLQLGPKIWLLGFSMGGAFCWAAARYIPHRIAGIALWAPVGNLWWKGISKKERKAMMVSYSPSDRRFSSIARKLPFFVYRWYAKRLSKRLVQAPAAVYQTGLSPRDWECIQRSGVDMSTVAFSEAMSHYKGYGVAKDLQLITRKSWGFQITDIGNVFKGHIHIWQGDQDTLVPQILQQWIGKQLPKLVTLHELCGEGHLSWVWFNDAAHRETFTTLIAQKKEQTTAITNL